VFCINSSSIFFLAFENEVLKCLVNRTRNSGRRRDKKSPIIGEMETAMKMMISERMIKPMILLKILEIGYPYIN
jgi:hypothetical protein